MYNNTMHTDRVLSRAPVKSMVSSVRPPPIAALFRPSCVYVNRLRLRVERHTLCSNVDNEEVTVMPRVRVRRWY